MKFFAQTLTSLSKVDNKVTSNIFSIVKVFIFNFSLNLLDGFKNGLMLQDRARRALQLWRTSNLNPTMASFENIQLNIFSHTFFIHFDFDFTFTFSYWRNGTFWADGFNSKVAQLDETFNLIYILRVVQGVSSTSSTAIQVKVVSKNWLRILNQGPRLPPGRSRNVKNSTMNN